jgi:hypothetical protein
LLYSVLQFLPVRRGLLALAPRAERAELQRLLRSSPSDLFSRSSSSAVVISMASVIAAGEASIT